MFIDSTFVRVSAPAERDVLLSFQSHSAANGAEIISVKPTL